LPPLETTAVRTVKGKGKVNGKVQDSTPGILGKSRRAAPEAPPAPPAPVAPEARQAPKNAKIKTKN
jgi:hypothetical protein